MADPPNDLGLGAIQEKVTGVAKGALDLVDKYVPSLASPLAPTPPPTPGTWQGQDGQTYKAGPNGPELATPTGLITIKNFPVRPVPATPAVQPTGLAQATPAGAPTLFGSPANRPVNQTIGGVQQLPFKE